MLLNGLKKFHIGQGFIPQTLFQSSLTFWNYQLRSKVLGHFKIMTLFQVLKF
jgi:hypothetical protein